MELIEIVKSRSQNIENSWVSFSDYLYCEHMLGQQILSEPTKRKWLSIILESRTEDGFFFDKNDFKSHNKFHLTAYALSTLKLLNYKEELPNINLAVRSITSENNITYPNKILDRLQFWRGSHTVAGKCAIILTCKEMNLLNDSDNIAVDNYIKKWFEFYDAKISQDGLWRPHKGIIQYSFDTLYRMRHSPILAKYGAAAHLYWIYGKCNHSLPKKIDVEHSIDRILGIYNKDKILEEVPYCLDYDVLCILNMLISCIPPERRKDEYSGLFLEAGKEILKFIEDSDERMWDHAFPGAIASLAECAKHKDFASYLNSKGLSVKDPFEEVFWL